MVTRRTGYIVVNNKLYDTSLRVQNRNKFSKHLLEMINQVIFLNPFIIITL